MARYVPTILVLALLVGSAAAFAVTERLKLEPSPIAGTLVDKTFSPVCDCPTDRAKISFRLRKPETMTVDLLDSSDHSVRTLVVHKHAPVGRLTLHWNGRDDSGQVVADGLYRPRVRLQAHGRTIVLPNPIQVDTTKPVVALRGVNPTVFSPDGDGRRDRIRVYYTVSERARASLLVNGKQRVLGRLMPLKGTLDWFGRRDGHPYRPGTYRIAVVAVDRAGNVSAPSAPAPVRIRYIELARTSIDAEAAKRFGVRVLTDARRFSWRFAGGTGTAEPGLLVLRAPRSPGTFTLFVEAHGHADRAVVRVGPPR